MWLTQSICLTFILSAIASMADVNHWEEMKSTVYYFPMQPNAPNVNVLKQNTKFADFVIGFITAGNNQCAPYWQGKFLVEKSHKSNSSKLFTMKSDSNDVGVQLNRTEDSLNDNEDRIPQNISEINKIIYEIDSFSISGISFGGTPDMDLVNTCQNEIQLSDAIKKVIEVYDISFIDFFMHDSLITKANMDKLSKALQIVRKDVSYELIISIVVPIEMGVGIKAGIIENMNSFAKIPDHIDLFMIKMFDFGTADLHTMMKTMELVPSQVKQYFKEQIDYIDEAVGVVFMSGVTGQVEMKFSQHDVYNLVLKAKRMKMGRVSLNSINRDVQCDKSAENETFPTFCSGIKQDPYEFTEIMEEFLYEITTIPSNTTGNAQSSLRGYSISLLSTIVLFIVLLSNSL